MTAGTIMHRSHLPLKTWLMAVHIVTSHSNGISGNSIWLPAVGLMVVVGPRCDVMAPRLSRA